MDLREHPGSIDLGSGFSMVFLSWQLHDRAGINLFHTKPNGREHVSVILFELEGIREYFGKSNIVEVISMEPLTIKTKIKCCNTNGFIKDEAWIPAGAIL